MRWMEREDAVDDSRRGIDWTDWGAQVAAGTLPPESVALAIGELIAFFKTKTKLELQTFGLEHEILPGIVFTMVASLISGIVFGQYLARFASNYVTMYAGLASVIIALVFLVLLLTNMPRQTDSL